MSKGQKVLDIEQALVLAAEHYNAQRISEARSNYQNILRADPNESTALHHLGLIAHQDGRNDIALELIAKATTIQPDRAEIHYDLGVVCQELRRLEDAKASYKKCLTISPDNAGAHNNLGVVLRDLGNFEDAVKSCRNAIDIQPTYAAAHSNLGLAYQDLGKLDDALRSFEEALRITQDIAEIHYNHGNVLQKLGRLKKSIDSYDAALHINPLLPDANTNLGLVLRDLGKLGEAQNRYYKALEINPNLAEARHNLGMLQLSIGDMQQGWKNYEWRWKIWPRNAHPSVSNKPLWEGDDLKGRTIYIYPEQGLGDSICFVRYLPLLKQFGCRVIFETPTSLASLFHHSQIADHLIKPGETPPDFDCHASLLDLPQHLKTTVETIPDVTPYLRVPEKLKQKWKLRFGAAKTFRLGIAWAGNSNLRQDHFRSATVEMFLPLAEILNIALYSLQVGPKVDATELLRNKITDCGPHLTDFAQTAAAISQLDLIVSVDTSVAHIAGALGRPTWTLLHLSPDWRWMYRGKTTPWYPTMQLFRQTELGQWKDVFQAVTAELINLADLNDKLSN